MAEAPILRVDALTKRFGDRVALNDVSFSVNAGEYVSLLGPSGAGKTVLLRAIAGFEQPEEGRVYLDGRDASDTPAHLRGIGFVFQNFALFPHLTVFDNVAFGLRNGARKTSEKEARERTQDMLDLVGLRGLEGRGVHQISGGQRQRVALARTLVTSPRLVLLDEPLGALDANLRLRMRGELRRIRERLGIPFLHVTGSESEALAMGDRLIVLDAGHIGQFGPPGDVYENPASPNVARFLNCYNLFDGALEGDAFVTSYGRFPYARRVSSAKAAYAVRYDRLTAEIEGGGLPGEYIATEYMGSSVVHFFSAPDGKVLEVERHLSNGPPGEFQPGRSYRLSWRREDAIAYG